MFFDTKLVLLHLLVHPCLWNDISRRSGNKIDDFDLKYQSIWAGDRIQLIYCNSGLWFDLYLFAKRIRTVAWRVPSSSICTNLVGLIDELSSKTNHRIMRLHLAVESAPFVKCNKMQLINCKIVLELGNAYLGSDPTVIVLFWWETGIPNKIRSDGGVASI